MAKVEMETLRLKVGAAFEVVERLEVGDKVYSKGEKVKGLERKTVLKADLETSARLKEGGAAEPFAEE